MDLDETGYPVLITGYYWVGQAAYLSGMWMAQDWIEGVVRVE